MASAEGDADEVDAAARRLIDAVKTPRRRQRPRVAEPLLDAEDLAVQTPDGAIAAWRLGTGPAVLFVHGWEDDNALWGPMIEQFALYGRSAAAIDLPGHGFSEAPLMGSEGAARAVRAAAAALGPIDAVVGHSFGCVALLNALDDGLEARRAVMIASPLPRGLAERLEREGDRLAPPEVVRRALALVEAAGEGNTEREPLKAAGRMRAEVLFIHSLDDEQCPASNSQALAAAWPGARTLYVDGLGHRLVAQDREVAQRVLDFVEGFPFSS
jgi:pimeloyl-ACP methyl ester carboxylesterase